MWWRNKRVWMGVGLLLMGVFLVLQFIPMEKENPPVVAEINWDSPQTRELAVNACFDCHSNETKWNIWADIAPSRVLVRRDVSEGRDHLNFSDWTGSDVEVDELEEVIREGEMPPKQYTILHPEARLSDAEKDQLIEGLKASALDSGADSLDDEAEDSDD